MEREMSGFSAPHFHDAEAARKHLEAIRWPDGPVCPHCGNYEKIYEVKSAKARAGVYACAACRKQFTVTVGTLFERSHVPLNLWFQAAYLLAGSKKGMSAHQIHRILGVTYKTAWFMCHRIREGMREFNPGALGGQNKVVEADETFVGGKAKNAKRGKPVPKKEAVFSLLERDGKVRSTHVPAVNHKNLRPAIVAQVDRKSYLMTDEAPVYKRIGHEFAGHGTVNHSIEEYVRGVFWHTNTIEGYFSILKRGINGVYQHVSQQHLKRYLGEFDFRYNNRTVSDMERAEIGLNGLEGTRLTYRDSLTAAM
jgi:transposase-like protein